METFQDTSGVFFGDYDLYATPVNYIGPDVETYYVVTGNHIIGKFFNGYQFNNEKEITHFILTKNTFVMQHVDNALTYSITWDNLLQKWTYSISNDNNIYETEEIVSIHFKLPLLFDAIFIESFTALVEKHIVTVHYSDGYSDGYRAGYIEGISITNDANATSDTIMSGYSAYVQGIKINGTIKTAHGGITEYVKPEEVGYMPYIMLSSMVEEPTCISPNTGGQIRLYAPLADFGDALPSEVPAGKTFTSSSGLLIEGTGRDWSKILIAEDESF